VTTEKAERFTVKGRPVNGRTVTVQRAFDSETRRDVVIKTLRADHATFPARVQAFSASSKLAARLLHATLVPVIAARRAGTRIFTASPWVPGVRLSDLASPMDVTAVAGIVAQLSDGMAVAHALGIILRGVNPRDVLIRADGAVFLSDLNKVQLPGTSGALPPPPQRVEVLRYLPMEARGGGVIDGQTDIFCLGALALELLTGVPPSEEGAIDMRPALVSALTASGSVGQLAKVAMTLCAPRPDQRPVSVANLTGSLTSIWESAGFSSPKTALAAALQAIPGIFAPTSVPASPSQPTSSSPMNQEITPAAASPAPTTAAGEQPSSMNSNPWLRPQVSATSRAIPLAPQENQSAPSETVDESEQQSLLEETTTELERQLVRDALAAVEVQPPQQDPWGLRSQGRFRSLREDANADGVPAAADNSGFSFVSESGKVEVGRQAAPISRSNPPMVQAASVGDQFSTLDEEATDKEHAAGPRAPATPRKS
jgi:serine/threonine protein kinase